ncbi:hypothetical protein FFLO_02024 [Filobasidium floriforme]|uniref:Bystin-domain-containing protein n=1 Tax=Filobasidium floriforme TaxID=5210 RepID=A0A8K0NS83_9TREE|nr:hypothetical protein FFLO_02024 [Filobasidium floriforme]
MPKATSATKNHKPRHTPLHVDISKDSDMQKFGRVASTNGKKGKDRASRADAEADGEDKEGGVVGGRMSRKILDLARDQQEEVMGEMEDDDDVDDEEDDDEEEEDVRAVGTGQRVKRPDADEEEDLEEGDVSDEEYAELEIDPEDYETLATLRRGGIPDFTDHNNNSTDLLSSLPTTEEPRTLADLIFNKLNEAGHSTDGGAGGVPGVRAVPNQPGMDAGMDGPLDPRVGLNPKVVEVYTKVGVLLSRYKSGPLPRALKILPSLPHWAQLLALTQPPAWTPHATYACTKIFVSNLKPTEVQVFLEGILLEKVRDNMMDGESRKGGKGGKLDVQLYEALKKGLYKPAAWFKGILFPLCEGGCTLKEATIIASVLTKISIPVLHSAAALLRLSNMEYTGPNSLFIRVLLDKKYALPYKVVDALVFHFIRLANTGMKGVRGISKEEEEKLPVLWHQSLLVFVQRYGADLTPDQKDALLDVIRARPHAQISPEIRREILTSVMRGEPRPEEGEGDVEMR